MSEFTQRQIEVNGLSMHVAEAGAGMPVLFSHGFPELWDSRRHQLCALAEAGYRAIAPDQRGFRGTDAPAAVRACSVHHLVGDPTGLLDALGLEGPVVVGFFQSPDGSSLAALQAGATVTQPALMITAELDPVLRPELADGMQALVPNLRRTHLVRDCGHWTQQEKPDEVNGELLTFLADLPR